MGNSRQSEARFQITPWTLVFCAARSGDYGADQALGELCNRYWYPVYAFLRRQGRSPHDAQDLTQSFFAQLLRREWLGKVNPDQGRFRTFLLACLRNHLGHERARDNGVKRRPAHGFVYMDAADAEGRYLLEPIDLDHPSTLLDRAWARSLIQRVLEMVRADYAEQGKVLLFDSLRDHLVGDADRGLHAGIAARLEMTEGALRVCLSRLRRRFRDELRAEVARTVSDPREVDEEIRDLVRLSRA